VDFDCEVLEAVNMPQCCQGCSKSSAEKFIAPSLNTLQLWNNQSYYLSNSQSLELIRL